MLGLRTTDYTSIGAWTYACRAEILLLKTIGDANVWVVTNLSLG
jgi:hypothetical protein